jgi:hypothetical protein
MGLALWSVKTTPLGLALWSVVNYSMGAYLTGTKSTRIMTYEDVTVQPIKLPGKQVKVLPEQFPFWLCSYI